MKVYLVTGGEYSEYHVAGVKTTREEAENLVRLLSCGSTTYEVEERDTDEYSSTMIRSELKKLTRVYEFSFEENGNLYREHTWETNCTWKEFFDCYEEIKETAELTTVIVFGESDRDKAFKIATDKRAKHFAKKYGL